MNNAHPDIRVEIIIDAGLTDSIESGYDAGIRLGEKVAEDMIAARLSPNVRAGVVGAFTSFADCLTSNILQELVEHGCLNFRFATSEGCIFLMPLICLSGSRSR